MLADRVEDVCRKLLPNGKQNNGEWECGSLLGEEGKSCKVRLSGAKAGIWSDFASGDAGDMLDLWAQSRNIKLGEAIREVKDWLGVSEPKFEPRQKTYAKPVKKDIKVVQGKAEEYLTTWRGLLKETIDTFKVAQDSGGGCCIFPYINPAGELVNIKHLGLKREGGKKVIWTEKDCAPSLFGWQAFKGGRTITITEGEIDAMTMYQYGVPALSVPFGAGGGNKNDWIDYEWDNLAQFDTIYLCYDNDEAGQSCVMEVAKRLGRHRCRSVILPEKDANECLQKGVADDIIEECLANAKSFTPDEIRSPSAFQKNVMEYFYPTDEASKGFAPFLFDRKIFFRPSEVTIWTGQSGHGKSVMLGQVMLDAMGVGERVAIASMEMKPHQTLGRMIRQMWALRFPEPQEIVAAIEWMQEKLWIYDILGNVSQEKIFELMNYSLARHGVKHFVIDSLMKCDVVSDDYEGQRVFMNKVASFAKTTDCHVHLVAHARKGKEEEVSGKSDVKGSSDIVNQVDNCLTVWRNKAKSDTSKVSKTNADAILFCDKQREYGWEGNIELSYISETNLYVNPRQDARQFWSDIGLLRYVPPSEGLGI